MRETIGGTWITQLVIVFMFVFSAFLVLSINYSKAFRVKNEVLSMIEKKEGISDSAIVLINNYLKNNNYKFVGKCEKGTYGINIDRTTINVADGKTEYNYCVSKTKSTAINFSERVYYSVNLFFKFNLPVIGDIKTFEVNGQTKDISYPLDNIKTEYQLIHGL